MATALMNSSELWLAARSLPRTGRVNTVLMWEGCVRTPYSLGFYRQLVLYEGG